MKAVTGLNRANIEKIISGRPYKSIKDFMVRCPLSKTAMIPLIKAGAFDNLPLGDFIFKNDIEKRMYIMGYYLSVVSEPKKKLTLSNFNTLLQKELVPEELSFEKRVFAFNAALKKNKKFDNEFFILDDPSYYNFFSTFFDVEVLDIRQGVPLLKQKLWDKYYKGVMEKAKSWIKENEEDILRNLNYSLFKDMWNRYAKGTISAWEMNSLCFYYHKHELADIDYSHYGISNFFELPSEPIVEKWVRNNRIPIFKTYKIIGTVIGKDDVRSSVSLLTREGVVKVKFTKEYFAMYSRQLSEKQEDGTKKVVEVGWFKRGTKVMVTGFRRDDTFVGKSYAHTLTHQLYKITKVDNDRMELEHERYGMEDK